MEDCNEAVQGLNWLAGCDPDHYTAPSSCSPLQQQVLSRVEGLAFCQKPSGDVDHPEAALRSLLKGGSPYDLGVANETLAPYQADLVSIPPDVSGCPQLGDVLPVQDRRFLEQERELMLRPAEVGGQVGALPYWDPVLKHNRRAYHALVKRLHSIVYFTYTQDPQCEVGVFFVWKSSKTKLRMITDARAPNRMFRDPPGVSLMTGEGLGRFEVECEDTVFASYEAMSALSVFVGLSDVRDCFHRMRVPAWLARYFAWRPVKASVVGLTGEHVDGKLLQSSDLVWPCPGSLCQGFSWSLYFAQRANEFIAGGVDPLADARLANDRGGPVVLKVGRSFYVYVDNLGVISTDEARVQAAMQSLEDTFNGMSLQLHKSEVSEGEAEALGCILEGRQMRSRCHSKRLWRIHHALKALLARGSCSGRALEIIIGHCTFLGLICRTSLSCFHAVYAFMRKNYDRSAAMWPSVRAELRAFMGISILLVQDWWRPWNRQVTSSDSSLVGYGMCKSWWPKDLVAKVGRVQERSRFKRAGSHSARESALTAAGFHLHGASWTAVDENTLADLTEAGWSLAHDFPEVRSGALKRSLWTPCFWGAWSHRENIGILEARTVLKSVRGICLTRFGNLRHLHLCDNLGVVLSIERNRSRNFKMLKVLRCISAYLLGRNVHLAIRWIPRELNISDEPSRVHDCEESNLLVDLVKADDFETLFPRAPTSTHADGQPAADAHRTRGRPVGKPSSNSEAAAAAAEEDPRIWERRDTLSEDAAQKSSDPVSRLHGVALAGHAGGCSEAPRIGEGAGQGSSVGRAGDHGFRERQHLIRMEGREKRRQRAHARKEAKRSASGAGDAAHGGQAGWQVLSGDCCHLGAGTGQLQATLARATDHGPGAVSGSQFSPGGGQVFGGPFQRQVSGGRGPPLWRLPPGLFDGHEARVQPAWGQAPATIMARVEGMAQTVPGAVASGLPTRCVVRLQLADGCQGPRDQGSFQLAPSLILPPTRGVAATATDGACAAHGGCDQSLVDGEQPFGDAGCIQGGREGRQHPSGLRVAAVCPPNAGSAAEGKAPGQSLELHVRRVPQGLPRGCEGTGRAGGSVSGSTLRAKHRSRKSSSGPRRSSETGRLDDTQECAEVREGGTPGSFLARPQLEHADRVQGGRAPHRGHHARPRLSRHPVASLRRAAGCYFADLFAGSGGVARAARRLGFASREWDILHGDGLDLTQSVVQYKIREDVCRGLVLGCMFAPPSSSFSHDRASEFRTDEFPWGLPQTPSPEQERVQAGNACFKAVFQIIKWLDAYRIPWIIEQPFLSKAWCLPQMKGLEQAAHTRCAVTDFCQFGSRWQRRTKLLAGNLAEDDLARCERLCHGPTGVCSRTSKRHFRLVGSSGRGTPWAQLAQSYPSAFCHHLAYSLLCRYLMPQQPSSLR